MAILLRALASLAVVATLISLATATNYTVGGPNGGWDMSSNVQTWASSQQFSAGDNLVFQYSPSHDVLEVSKADYDSCQSSSPLQTYTGGNTVVPLTSPGKRYFICGSSGHCSLGMKVEIDTLASSATTPPAATTSPPSPPLVTSPVVPPVSSPLPAPADSPESPTESPESGPVLAPSPESTANFHSKSGSVQTHQSTSSATDVNTLLGCSAGFGFALVMLLTL